jgi:murein DD-endopeptidase MepM/ murein hydrolase activator NlpD
VPPKQATRPRHAAPKDPVHRTVLVPAVLLAAAGTAFAGLAIVPAAADERPVQRVVAASAFTPLDVPAPGAELPTSTDVLRNSNESVKRSAADALRRADEEKAAADKAAADKAAADKAAADSAAVADRASRDRSAPPPAPKPAASRYVRPGDGRLTSGFGRRWGRLHAGIDLAAGTGSPVRTVTSGTVVSAGRESGYGNCVRIRHADGTETLYGHLSRILVSSGSKVAPGQQIGKEGNTGRSTGPHLHFEVRVNGSTVNPLTWLRSKGVRV